MNEGPGPGPPPPGRSAFGNMDERSIAVIAHLTGLAWIAVGIPGFIGPLIVYLMLHEDQPWAKAHARESLNFQLSLLIWGILCGILVFVLVGIPLLIALWIMNIVCCILGAVAANRGEFYFYPLTMRFVH